MKAERYANAFDTEGLQADVMRFLAIIAFCLIAILALVEKQEPAPTDEVLPRIPEPMAQETEEVPTEHPKPVSPANIVAAEPAPAPTRLEPVIPPEPAIEPEPTTVPVPASAPIAESAELVLRFASASVFLSLISKEDIQLFVHDEQSSFFALSPAFIWQESPPSGELFEILPASLPPKITGLAMRKGLGGTYFVQLPESAVRQIGELAEEFRNQGGSLVVTGNGTIIYEN